MRCRSSSFVVVLILTLGLPACASSGGSAGSETDATDSVGSGTGASTGVSTGSGSATSSDGSTGADPACAAVQERLQVAADGFVANHGLPGAVLAVSAVGCPDAVVASGLADVETREPMTVDHRLGVGSLTKSYVAALMLLLQEEGLVDLDAPLSGFVSAADVPGADVLTIRQLMSHQSGIADFQSNADFVDALMADPKRVWAPMELVQYGVALGPTFPPGEGWGYSNTNYILVGMVAEQASGLSLGEALRSRVLDPAGLEHTYFDGEETVQGPLARGYYTGMDVTGYLDPSWAWASGSMVATGGDLLKWTDVLFRGPLLNDASKTQLVDWVDTGGTPIEHYGLGVFLYDLDGGTIVGHNGGIPGYQAAMGDRFATDDLAVVAFNVLDDTDPLSGVDVGLGAIDGG
jgi:D-alanyl-D-alanine carboxypeptidase